MASTKNAWVVIPSSFAAVAEFFFSVSLNLIEVVLDLLVDLLLSLDMGIFSKKNASRVVVVELTNLFKSST